MRGTVALEVEAALVFYPSRDSEHFPQPIVPTLQAPSVE
jgi:hypothetical protein